jgi:hypothetical protein
MGKKAEKEHIIIRMVISILANGLKIKNKEMVSWNTQAEQFMMENGLMIRLLIKEKSFMQIKINTKDIS